MDKYIIGVNLGTKVVTMVDIETKELTWTKIGELRELIVNKKINITKNHITDGEAVGNVPDYFCYAISTADPYLNNEQYALISVESLPELGENMVKVRFSDIRGNIQEKTVNENENEQLNIRGYDLIFDDEDIGNVKIAKKEIANINEVVRDWNRERTLKWVEELTGKESTYEIENRQRSIVNEINNYNTGEEKRSKLKEVLKELDRVRYEQREVMIKEASNIDMYSRRKYLEAMLGDFRISSDECREINKEIMRTEWEIKEEEERKQKKISERIEKQQKEISEIAERKQREISEIVERQHIENMRKAREQLGEHLSKNKERAEKQLMEHYKVNFDVMSEYAKEAYLNTLEKRDAIQEERETYRKTINRLTNKLRKLGATESDVRMTIDAVKEMHTNPVEQRKAVIKEMTEWYDRLISLQKTKDKAV